MALDSSRRSVLGALSVPVAATLANLVSYALLLVAAHVMTASEYGALASVLGLLLISTIPMLALQTVAARRTAAGTGPAGVIRGAVLVGAASTALFAALSPFITRFLHLDSVTDVLLVAACVPPSALLGTAMGVAQGRREFPRLAALILVATGGRSLGGLVGLALHPSTTATMTGVLIGTTAAAVAVGVHGGGVPRFGAAVRDRSRRGVVPETLHAAHAHGTFLLLTSLDVLLARHVLSPAAAGAYGVGAVITRAALWLPQSVVALMFASLAQNQHYALTARRATAVVAGLGALAVAGTALLAPVVVTVVGGSRYHGLDSIAWLFALLGALLALVQLAVLAGLAQRRVRRAALLWLTIAADVILVLWVVEPATTGGLVTTLVIVAAVAAAVAVVLTLRQTFAPDGQGSGTNVGSSPGSKADSTPTALG